MSPETLFAVGPWLVQIWWFVKREQRFGAGVWKAFKPTGEMHDGSYVHGEPFRASLTLFHRALVLLVYPPWWKQFYGASS